MDKHYSAFHLLSGVAVLIFGLVLYTKFVIVVALNRHPVEDRLVREVLRKLHLATEADHKDDREVICGEVFDDINGILDETSQAHLGVQRECRFYEVLAPYLSRKWDAAEGLLYVCRRLWGQPYVAPVYALLLHQWLLLNREAGGGPERAKHINVMVSGAKQLFWGDIEGMRMHFRPLFVWLCDNVIFSLDRRRLDDLPPRSRRTLLSCCAGFMAYYYSPEELGGAILAFPSPDHTLTDGGHVDGEGTDFVIGEITDTLKETTTEYSLLRCLRSLTGLQGNVCLAMMGRITKLRLQAELTVSSIISALGIWFIAVGVTSLDGCLGIIESLKVPPENSAAGVGGRDVLPLRDLQEILALKSKIDS